jgi:hypothetical protein
LHSPPLSSDRRVQRARRSPVATAHTEPQPRPRPSPSRPRTESPVPTTIPMPARRHRRRSTLRPAPADRKRCQRPSHMEPDTNGLPQRFLAPAPRSPRAPRETARNRTRTPRAAGPSPGWDAVPRARPRPTRYRSDVDTHLIATGAGSVTTVSPASAGRSPQPFAYSSAARDSNSNPTNRSSPTTQASWPGSMTYASPGPSSTSVPSSCWMASRPE